MKILYINYPIAKKKLNEHVKSLHRQNYWVLLCGLQATAIACTKEYTRGEVLY